MQRAAGLTSIVSALISLHSAQPFASPNIPCMPVPRQLLVKPSAVYAESIFREKSDGHITPYHAIPARYVRLMPRWRHLQGRSRSAGAPSANLARLKTMFCMRGIDRMRTMFQVSLPLDPAVAIYICDVCVPYTNTPTCGFADAAKLRQCQWHVSARHNSDAAQPLHRRVGL